MNLYILLVSNLGPGSHHIHPVKPKTIARSIAIGNPADGYYALRIARQSGGGAISASDDESIEGMKLLAQTEGIFSEAAGGVVVAGLKKLVASGAIKRNGGEEIELEAVCEQTDRACIYTSDIVPIEE